MKQLLALALLAGVIVAGCSKAEDPAVQAAGAAPAPVPTSKAEASTGMSAPDAMAAPPGVQTGTP